MAKPKVQSSRPGAAPALRSVSLGGTSYERVRDSLRTDIVTGRLPAGSRLKVAELAGQFGLSLMPVREALQQLQGEGLVVVIPKRGAVVRVPDRNLVAQIFDIRIALEGALARRAAAVVTAADLKRLRKVMDSHKAERADREAHMRHHLDFHQIINAISGNAEAITILDRHNQIIFCLRRSVGFGPTRIDDIVADHEAIYSAIAVHDERGAERAAQGHATRAKTDMLSRMVDNDN